MHPVKAAGRNDMSVVSDNRVLPSNWEGQGLRFPTGRGDLGVVTSAQRAAYRQITLALVVNRHITQGGHFPVLIKFPDFSLTFPDVYDIPATVYTNDLNKT